MHEFLNKVDDIAVFIAGPTTVTLAPGVDIERWTVVIMKGTNALENRSGRAQRDVAAHDIDDVVSLFHPLFQGYPIVRQRAPGDRNTKGTEGLSVKTSKDASWNDSSRAKTPQPVDQVALHVRVIYSIGGKACQ